MRGILGDTSKMECVLREGRSRVLRVLPQSPVPSAVTLVPPRGDARVPAPPVSHLEPHGDGHRLELLQEEAE